MKAIPQNLLARSISRLIITSWLFVAAGAWAGALTISDAPLATGAGLSVKPNLLFILDNSGSMRSEYTPDWVNDDICQNSMEVYGTTHNYGCRNGFPYTVNISGTDYTYDGRADPPYMAAAFNTQYYNPATRYRPPKDYLGVEWANATPTAAKDDPFLTPSGSTINLTTGYPDVYWCKNAGDTAPGANCQNNAGTHYGYGYPNNLWSNQKNVNGRPVYYVMSGSPTWCSNKALTTCQATRTSTFQYPRFSDPVATQVGAPGSPEILATRAKITIKVSTATSGKLIEKVKCGKDSTGSLAFSGTYSSNGNLATVTSWLAGKLSGCSASTSGAWVVTYPGASGSTTEIDVSWPVTGTVGNGKKFYIAVDTDSLNGFTIRIGGAAIDNTSLPALLTGFTLAGGQDYQAAVAGVADIITFPTSGVQFTKVTIDPAVTTYQKYSTRGDCAGTDCTYAEELQNFANWYQYYRSRMKLMKSAVSRVFADVTDTAPGNGFRVGFDRISRTSADLELSIDNFTTTAGGQKQTFYTNLFDADGGSYTPLRGSLSKAGRVYAGTISPDPVQASCQQNFTFLSTDGYWNANTETSSYGPFKEDGTTAVGNQDGTGSVALSASATLTFTIANASTSVTQVKCGDTNATAAVVFSGTHTTSGSTTTARRNELATWLGSLLGSCPHPAEGAWAINVSNNTVSIGWPLTGVVGNGKPFFIDLVVSSTSNITANLGGTIVTQSSMPGTLDSKALSGGAEATTTQVRPYLDALGAASTLADVAMYYWKNDLRSSLTNDVPTSSRDTANWQHMTTFTMGLGIDGTLQYAADYETGGSADYEAIKGNTKDWPNPITNTTDARIDDLWHAAVNGRGQYFSASSPDDVTEAFTTTISTIAAITGAAAAAATSNLEPTAGDNFAYVASYRTQVWDGDLQSKEIDLSTGTLSATSAWSSAYKMSSQGARTLYTFDSSLVSTDKKRLLTWASLRTTGPNEQAYFDVTQLSQCNPATICPGATATNLFSFLMGGVDATTNGSYRARQNIGDVANAAATPVKNILGDIVDSQPIYVGAPSLAYTENGYATFKSGTAAARGKTVYVGANDGFVHAFNADTGVERWAYMPSVLLSSIYKLADTAYTHTFYQDGVIAVTDAYDGTSWRSMLVTGMNKGGNYYFALDVTDPAAPQALWEFTDASLGYSYGNPIITKLPTGATDSGGTDVSGKWVVLLTSGYNNSGGNGQGIVYVLDVFTGAEVFRMATTSASASAASPVGLARINAWADDPLTNNTSLYVYGGDLNGDLWRFNLTTKAVGLMASVGEPITVKPELGEISSSRVVFFGTGLFLQDADKSDTSGRTIFAIKDTGVTQTNLKTSGNLVQQTFVAISGDDNHRSTTANPVDWTAKSGWFINLPDSGERVNVDPKLVLGTLVVATNVPQATSSLSCTAGGYSWLNYFDWQTGSYVVSSGTNPDNFASTRLPSALAVGVNVVRLPNNKVVAIVTTSDNLHPKEDLPIGSSGASAVRRISWRELIVD